MPGLTKVIIGVCAVVVVCGCATGGGVSHHQAAMPPASCGIVATHQFTSETELLSASPGALACFFGAARDCKTASIHVTEMGVDTGTQYVLALQPGRTPCQVTEYSQDYSANFGGSEGPVAMTSCDQVALTRGGLTLRCGSVDYLIPATVQSGTAAS
jgi:hypothetical protein